MCINKIISDWIYLQLAEEYYYYTFAVVFAIGLLQGVILARGIRKKFPKLKKYAKGISIILLILIFN